MDEVRLLFCTDYTSFDLLFILHLLVTTLLISFSLRCVFLLIPSLQFRVYLRIINVHVLTCIHREITVFAFLAVSVLWLILVQPLGAPGNLSSISHSLSPVLSFPFFTFISQHPSIPSVCLFVSPGPRRFISLLVSKHLMSYFPSKDDVAGNCKLQINHIFSPTAWLQHNIQREIKAILNYE